MSIKGKCQIYVTNLHTTNQMQGFQFVTCP